MINAKPNEFNLKDTDHAENAMHPPDERSLEEVSGGNNAAVPNPLMMMLDMYYQIAMEKTDPLARADAVKVYNQTLEKMIREGGNCAGYSFIQA